MEFCSSFLPFILLKSPTHEALNMCLNLNFYYIPHQPLVTPSDRCKQMQMQELVLAENYTKATDNTDYHPQSSAGFGDNLSTVYKVFDYIFLASWSISLSRVLAKCQLYNLQFPQKGHDHPAFTILPTMSHLSGIPKHVCLSVPTTTTICATTLSTIPTLGLHSPEIQCSKMVKRIQLGAKLPKF